jgi:glycosyltransferase involved in cell wall biosynthesis
MIDRRITFCIPSKNNLRYLKHSINSIKENSMYENEIIVYVDADNDGTKEWLDANNIKYLVNETNIPKGIAYGYNRCIEAATTPIVCMFHADMYMGQWFDEEILKHLKPLSVVSGTRIEPPLHPQGLEKIIEDFGMYPEDFKKQEFDKFVYEMRYTYQDKTTKGIFAPWAIYKEDITSIGMHDESFHSYHEDSDMFNRFILNGYEIIQTWAALVYHLTCRGGQFQDGIEKVTTDPVFHKMKQNAFRNYIRKWGHFVKNNEYQYPIIPHRYNIGITLINPTYEIFNFLEPWASNINVNLPSHQLDMYVELEQPNTTINLKDKINNDSVINDIEVKIDGNKMTNESVNFIVELSAILDDNNLEIGEYQFDIFNIKVNKIRHYESELIKCNN